MEGDGEVDGRPFYFRARWEVWSLAITAPGTDPLDMHFAMRDGWIHEERWPGGSCAAGYMTMDEVQQCMEHAVALFRSGHPGKRPE